MENLFQNKKILFTLILIASCFGILGVAEKTFAATDCVTDEGGVCCDVSVNQFACSNVIVGATGCGVNEICCQIESCADCITGKKGICCDVSVNQFACSNVIVGATGCGGGECCCQVESCQIVSTVPMLPTNANTTPATPTNSINVQAPALTNGDASVNLPTKKLSEILEDLIKWLLKIVILIAILMIIVSGAMYMISAGDQTKTDTAKKALTYAILGLLVVALAYAIVNTLVDILS